MRRLAFGRFQGGRPTFRRLRAAAAVAPPPRRDRTSPSGRDGTVLVVVLVLVLALTGLAHGLLTVARAEYRIARAGADWLGAQGAAQVGVAAILNEVQTLGTASTQLWQVGLVLADSAHGGRYSSELVRLSDETWLIRSTGHVRGVSSPTMAKAVWILDPAAQVARAGALIAASSVVMDTSATLIASSFADPALAPASGCAWGSRVASIGHGPLAATKIGRFSAAVGRLSVDSLERRIADPSIVTRGDLALGGGTVGAGLLIVRGNLELTAHSHSGFILATGDVTIGYGSSVTGLIRAEGTVSVLDSSTVRASACWAADALALPALRRPVTQPGWLGPF